MPGTQALLSIKQLILTVAIAFSVHSFNGHALEESMALAFALAVGKALITTPKPFIEVSSTKEVYVREVVALPLSDTQCLHTQIQEEQVCFGNNQPTRIRLLPDDQLKIGLHSLGISQVENILHPIPVADPLFPVQDGLSLPELDSMAKAIATEIQQGDDRHREIIEKAKQSRSLVLSRFSIEEDSDAIQWWGLKQEPDADDSDMAQARLDDSILLKPDTRYCFFPDSGTGAKAYNRAASDDGSGGEDSDTSDESNDNDSDDDESVTESDVEYIGTTSDPFPVSREVSEYCANQVLMRIKQEPTSDSEIPIESEVVVEVVEADSTNNLESTPLTCQSLNPPTAKKKREAGSKEYPCRHQDCDLSFATQASLNSHKSQYHSGEKTCPDCQKPLKNAKALSNHKRQEHSGEQTCPVCQKTLKSAKALSDHKQKEHSGKQTCPVCQKTVSNAKALCTHKSQYHSGEKICPDCQKTLSNAKALSDHKRQEHSEKQTCPVCQRIVPNAKALSTHKSHYHSGEKICPDCQKPLKNTKALSDHKRRMHRKRKHVDVDQDDDLSP